MQRFRNFTKYMTGESTRPLRPYLRAASLIRRIPLRRRRRLVNNEIVSGEREKVQKKTFTKWCNSHLAKVSIRVSDLYTGE